MTFNAALENLTFLPALRGEPFSFIKANLSTVPVSVKHYLHCVRFIDVQEVNA